MSIGESAEHIIWTTNHKVQADTKVTYKDLCTTAQISLNLLTSPNKTILRTTLSRDFSPTLQLTHIYLPFLVYLLKLRRILLSRQTFPIMSDHDDLIAQFVDVAGVPPQEVCEPTRYLFMLVPYSHDELRPGSTSKQHNGISLQR